jgi:hypothetical protein
MGMKLAGNQTNQVRLNAGIIYFIAGVLCLILFCILKWPNIVDWISKQVSLLWCLGWTAVGIGCGLINTRNLDGGGIDREYKHYFLLYYLLALLLVFLATITTGLLSGEILDTPTPKFYALTALTSLILGLLAEDINKLIKWPLKFN